MAGFAEALAKTAKDFFGDSQVNNIVGQSVTGKLFLGTAKHGFWRKRVGKPIFPAGFDVVAYKKAVDALVEIFYEAFGLDFTNIKLDEIYISLERRFDHELVRSVLLSYLPVRFLEKRRVQYLSKEELEKQVLAKTNELKKLNEVLEQKVQERTEELRNLLQEQNVSARLLVRRDLELTLANEKLRELDERKSEFLSVAAHQLRTPLSGIKWTLSMIIHGELGLLSNDQKVFLMKSYESNERMINIVEEMLHADRIDSGRYRLNLVSTNILDIVDNVLYEILPGAKKKNVGIQLNRDAKEFPKAMVDQEKIRAVFQNLLENAVKYSKEGGIVSVNVSLQDRAFTISVKDKGIGIPSDQQGDIFSRFFRARNALKMETSGTGLGLFIAKSIIEKHGGKIWYESTENEGSVFYFTILINN